jgi:hypothetical protein
VVWVQWMIYQFCPTDSPPAVSQWRSELRQDLKKMAH